MPNLLIRDIPDDVIAAIDAKARLLGLSRSEYLRRQMTQAATAGETTVTAESLRQFSETFSDLGDDTIMRTAWE